MHIPTEATVLDDADLAHVTGGGPLLWAWALWVRTHRKPASPKPVEPKPPAPPAGLIGHAANAQHNK